jgi:hypothetical protein
MYNGVVHNSVIIAAALVEMLGVRESVPPLRALVEAVVRWESFVEGSRADALDDLLAEDVVLYSPVAFTPQRGRDVVARYLRAARQVLLFEGDPELPFRYTRRVLGDDVAVLEFETTVDHKYVNGVDIVRCDDGGAIVEFRVMIRPLQALNCVRTAMAAALGVMSREAHG